MDIFHCSVSLSCYHLQMLLMILKECGPQISATTETLKIQSALWWSIKQIRYLWSKNHSPLNKFSNNICIFIFAEQCINIILNEHSEVWIFSKILRRANALNQQSFTHCLNYSLCQKYYELVLSQFSSQTKARKGHKMTQDCTGKDLVFSHLQCSLYIVNHDFDQSFLCMALLCNSQQEPSTALDVQKKQMPHHVVFKNSVYSG